MSALGTDPADRCASAHPDDPTPCVGPQDIVRLVDQFGTATLGCIPHTARSYASMVDPHVYPAVEGDAASDQAAITVYYLALEIRPHPWLAEGRKPGGVS